MGEIDGADATPEDSRETRSEERLRQVMAAGRVLVGAADLVATARDKIPPGPLDVARLADAWRKYEDAIKDVRIRIGTLLKLDNVSFLIGAGCSLESGGISLATIPYQVERETLRAGHRGQGLRAWLRVLYRCIATCAAYEATTETNAVRRRFLELLSVTPVDIPRRCQHILDQKVEDNRLDPAGVTVDDLHTFLIPINLEVLLSRLHSWMAAGQGEKVALRFEAPPARTITGRQVLEAANALRAAFLTMLKLPKEGCEGAADVHREFLQKILTRPVNLRRVHLFTLNNDTLLEQAADTEGVVMLDGFVGGLRRTFRPESYDHDLYFPGQTTEGRVHRLDRVVHLYKLHGSITWRREEPSWHNPYGVLATDDETPSDDVLIYPTPLKYGEALGLPYSELFRRFGAAVVQPQSVLFAIGYGFGDEHVNVLIRQSLAMPSFNLVVVDPHPTSEFMATLKSLGDQRVWVVEGEGLGTFRAFVRTLLPDLIEERTLRKVMDTYKALSPAAPEPPVVGGDDHAQ